MHKKKSITGSVGNFSALRWLFLKYLGKGSVLRKQFLLKPENSTYWWKILIFSDSLWSPHERRKDTNPVWSDGVLGRNIHDWLINTLLVITISKKRIKHRIKHFAFCKYNVICFLFFKSLFSYYQSMIKYIVMDHSEFLCHIFIFLI